MTWCTTRLHLPHLTGILNTLQPSAVYRTIPPGLVLAKLTTSFAGEVEISV